MLTLFTVNLIDIVDVIDYSLLTFLNIGFLLTINFID